MADAKPGAGRPLSPHLSIYKPMLTMMMSIFHRLTGMALYAGALLFAWWLIAAAMGPDQYGAVSAVADTIFGRLVLFGFTWALMHHMLGGLRHLLWDTGHGFELPMLEILAQATIIGSLALTALVWAIGLYATGAF